MVRLRQCVAVALLAGMLVLMGAKHHDAAGPKTVYIIRHAEKPDGEKDPHLSPRGQERAKALVKAFPKDFAAPDVIIATAVSKQSERPIETVTPLAEKLHLKLETDYADNQVEELAHAVLTDHAYAGKDVLICWHHGQIPHLAKALGAKDVPDKWPADVFDRVWVLKFDGGEAGFEDRPQRAMEGDSKK